jgi:hypothetical protein
MGMQGVRVLIETRPAKEPEPAPRRGSRQPYHAVVIAAPANACAAAQACKGKRYLSTEAPRLPLADCNSRRCECKYRHYDDRRGGPRRQDEKATPPVGARERVNRRATRGRRASD